LTRLFGCVGGPSPLILGFEALSIAGSSMRRVERSLRSCSMISSS
jgi:hypothetical protein